MVNFKVEGVVKAFTFGFILQDSLRVILLIVVVDFVLLEHSIIFEVITVVDKGDLLQ